MWVSFINLICHPSQPTGPKRALNQQDLIPGFSPFSFVHLCVVVITW